MKKIKSKNSLIKNIFHSGTGKLFQVLTGIVTTSLTARYLGVEDYGTYALIWAVLLILSIIPDAGLKNVLVRAIITDKSKAGIYLGGVLTVRLFMCIVIFIPAIFTARFAGASENTLTCLYIGFFYIYFQLTLNLIYSVYLSFERLEIENFLTILYCFLILIFIYSVTRWDYGIIGIFTAHSAVNLIIMLLSLLILRFKFFSPVFRNDPALWKELLKSSALVGISRLSKGIYNYMDTILLKVLKSSYEVGIYSSGYNIVQRLNFIPAIIARPFYPILSWFAINDKEGINILLITCLKMMSAIAIPISIMVFFSAEQIVLLILGSEFIETVIVIQWLSPLVYFSFPNLILWFAGLSLNIHGFMAVSAVLAVVVNCTLDIILIPVYGYIGPCISSIAAELLFFTIVLYRIKTHLTISIFKIIHALLLPMAAGAAMIAVFIITDEINIFFQLTISATAYTVCVIITKAFTLKDLQNIKLLLVKKNRLEDNLYGKNRQ